MASIEHSIESILPLPQSPSRYTGEYIQAAVDRSDVHVLLLALPPSDSNGARQCEREKQR